jgi:hypothetical protein
MTHRRNDEDEYSVAPWFPESLSDETAVAVYLFLEQFTHQFEDHYYGQIRRYYQQQQEENVAEKYDNQLEMPWEDKIPF